RYTAAVAAFSQRAAPVLNGKITRTTVELVGPMSDPGPFRGVEESLRRHVQCVAVHVRSAACPGARQHQHVVVFHPLDAVHPRFGLPQAVGEVPVRLRDVLVVPPLAGFHHPDPVTLLGRAERRDAAAEPGPDDHDVVVEACHFLSLRRMPQTTVRSGAGRSRALCLSVVMASPFDRYRAAAAAVYRW